MISRMIVTLSATVSVNDVGSDSPDAEVERAIHRVIDPGLWMSNVEWGLSGWEIVDEEGDE